MQVGSTKFCILYNASTKSTKEQENATVVHHFYNYFPPICCHLLLSATTNFHPQQSIHTHIYTHYRTVHYNEVLVHKEESL